MENETNEKRHFVAWNFQKRQINRFKGQTGSRGRAVWSLDREHNGEKCICVAFHQEFWCRYPFAPSAFFLALLTKVLYSRHLYRFESARFAVFIEVWNAHCVVSKDIYRNNFAPPYTQTLRVQILVHALSLSKQITAKQRTQYNRQVLHPSRQGICAIFFFDTLWLSSWVNCSMLSRYHDTIFSNICSYIWQLLLQSTWFT